MNTVKNVLRGHLKRDKTKILMTNGNLMYKYKYKTLFRKHSQATRR